VHGKEKESKRGGGINEKTLNNLRTTDWNNIHEQFICPPHAWTKTTVFISSAFRQMFRCFAWYYAVFLLAVASALWRRPRNKHIYCNWISSVIIQWHLRMYERVHGFVTDLLKGSESHTKSYKNFLISGRSHLYFLPHYKYFCYVPFRIFRILCIISTNDLYLNMHIWTGRDLYAFVTIRALSVFLCHLPPFC
jgi:hypothetical protein